VERPAQSRDLMLVLPALPGSLRAARAAIRAGLDPLGWPTERAEDIELAVNEAVANVVDHAYPPGAPGPANLHAWLSTNPRTRDRRIVVTVTDRGRWARHHPDTHPAPDARARPGRDARLHGRTARPTRRRGHHRDHGHAPCRWGAQADRAAPS